MAANKRTIRDPILEWLSEVSEKHERIESITFEEITDLENKIKASLFKELLEKTGE